MPFRPEARYRKNIRGVIYPLTAAVAQTYGVRDDGAYPIGAFYTVNIDSKIWLPAGGIWYRPIEPDKILSRDIRDEDTDIFIIGIATGDTTVLRSGKSIDWEQIPDTEAEKLPFSIRRRQR